MANPYLEVASWIPGRIAALTRIVDRALVLLSRARMLESMGRVREARALEARARELLARARAVISQLLPSTSRLDPFAASLLRRAAQLATQMQGASIDELGRLYVGAIQLMAAARYHLLKQGGVNIGSAMEQRIQEVAQRFGVQVPQIQQPQQATSTQLAQPIAHQAAQGTQGAARPQAMMQHAHFLQPVKQPQPHRQGVKVMIKPIAPQPPSQPPRVGEVTLSLEHPQHPASRPAINPAHLEEESRALEKLREALARLRRVGAAVMR